ncbi:MAG: SulP family inorganic anion transporter [Chlamydiota bacterium]
MNQKVFWDIFSGLFAGLLLSIFSVMCANMVFSQFLQEYLSIGIFLSLLGTSIMSLVFCYTTKLNYTVVSPHATIAVICSIITNSILQDNQDLPTEHRLITIVTMVATTTILIGVIFYLLGRFKVGILVEYIPYPVISGFLAGTGVLIAIAGLELNTGVIISRETITSYFQYEVLINWLPEVAYAICILYIVQKSMKPSMLIALLILGTIGFYSILWGSGHSYQDAEKAGLLLGPFNDYNVDEIKLLFQFSQINWNLIFSYTPDYLIAAVFGVISLLFNITSIEVITNDEIDINQELRSSGIANILGGLVGSIGGFHQLLCSLLSRQLGAITYLSSWVRTLTVLCIAIFGIPFIGFTPKALFATILLYIGGKRFRDWILYTYHRLSFYEYLIIPIITLGMVIYGLVAGLVIGLVASIILFAVQYSRIKIIKNEINGSVRNSNVVWDVLSKKLIREHAKSIHIIFLQSYIFFGNATVLVNKFRTQFENELSNNINYLILDFQKVLGADASTIYSFVKISRLCKSNNVQLIVSNLPQNVIKKIEAAKQSGYPISFLYEKDLDHALEYCEVDILKVHGKDLVVDLETNYQNLLPSVSRHPDFFKSLKRVHVKKGDLIIRENAPSDCLYFLESGRIYIFATDNQGQERRIKVLNKGTIVGEIGFILEINRTASIKATEDCILAKITIEQLKELRETKPDVLADFYHDMLTIATKRNVTANKLIHLLID